MECYPDVPVEHRSRFWTKKAVWRNIRLVRAAPAPTLTPLTCHFCTAFRPETLQWIPPSFQTLEMVAWCVARDPALARFASPAFSEEDVRKEIDKIGRTPAKVVQRHLRRLIVSFSKEWPETPGRIPDQLLFAEVFDENPVLAVFADDFDRSSVLVDNDDEVPRKRRCY